MFQNPQQNLYVTLCATLKKTTRPSDYEQKNERQNANASAKSKELHPHAQSQLNAAHLLLPLPHNDRNQKHTILIN